MSWEAISAGAAVVTTVVITATAIAALIQIRQLKLATQLEGFLALHREYASPEMYAAREYVANELPRDCVMRNTAMSWKKVQHSSRRILSSCLGTSGRRSAA